MARCRSARSPDTPGKLPRSIRATVFLPIGRHHFAALMRISFNNGHFELKQARFLNLLYNNNLRQNRMIAKS